VWTKNLALASFARPLDLLLLIVSDPKQTNERPAMKPHRYARGLLAGVMSVMALAGGTGVAHADSDPFLPGGPGVIDQIVTETPILSVTPAEGGGSSADWGGVGMYCENPSARCH
jgi:hypothetical protein